MATKRNTPSYAADVQEEMTVVVLRLKGGGDTLKKGFDALASAFNSLGPMPHVIRSSNGGEAKLLKASMPDVEEHVESDEDEVGGEDFEAAPTQAASAPRPRPKPKFLDDFDLVGTGQSWQDFAASKDPKSENDKYLLAALWLAEKGGVPDFAVSHVFTCFRALKWNEQADFSQPLRAMKSKSSYFSNPSRKTYRLTQPGLSAARAIADV